MKSFYLVLEECLNLLSDGTATVDDCLARYPQHAEQLKPFLRTVRFLKLGRNVKLSRAFKDRSRAYLLQRLRFNPRQAQRRQLSRQFTTAFAVLIAALLFTGTVHAQSVLPGDNFYPWKRASEEIWRALSINPVDADIAISERRLNEWMEVAEDPILSADAKQGYFEELTRLKQRDNPQTHQIIAPVIKNHQEVLDDAGLPGAELVSDYLTLQITPSPVATVIEVILPTFTPEPTSTLNPGPIIIATDIPPTDTQVPTVAPTHEPTATPTDEPTAIPTEPSPTATEPGPTATPVDPTATETVVPPAPPEIIR